MPARESLGERISSVEATLGALEKYEHERWHKLSNDLQPLVALPEKITRDIAKMQGIFDGKINAVSREIERSITAAVEKAIAPMSEDIGDLRLRVDELERQQQTTTGARKLGEWIVSTLFAAVAAIGAVLAMGRHP